MPSYELLPRFLPLLLMGLALLAFVFYMEYTKSYNINKIKKKTVGDGQHGAARLATKLEIQKSHRCVRFEPKKWRNGKNLPIHEGFIYSMPSPGKALINSADHHILIVAGPGGGKTTGILCPNIEYTLASGNSFVTTDSKGDLLQWYGRIAAEDYGYTIFVIDFRNPLESQSNNMLHLVNTYFDQYKKNKDLRSLALAEKHAKIIASAVIHSGGFKEGGQNAFFYDAAEGLIAAVCLLVAEFCQPKERHIVTVFKMILEMLAPAEGSTEKKKKTAAQDIMEHLPAEHKARWLSGSALNSGGASAASVITTAMSRLLSLIDSESEQILCFDPAVTINQLCSEKVAIFLVFPEEDKTKHVLVSLMIQQMYNAVIAYADEYTTNHFLDRRLYFFEDEFGIFPKQENFQDMTAAGRSRNMFLVPIVQSVFQLHDTYGQNGAKSVMSCCKSVIFGGFAPLSDDAEFFSKHLGNQTVSGGSVSNSSNAKSSGSSKNISMISRPLMTADELKQLPQFSWVVQHGSSHPFISKMPHWTKWKLRYDKPFTMSRHDPKEIHYGNCKSLKTAIIDKYGVDFIAPDELYEEDDGRAASIEMMEVPEPDMAAY
ncbi:type IV secretory system conjugative DNA transfer family protein [Scatolibacter rhodanostii]|uniref:type IV secretory system conjugative DNA transfer family protein n=1 Tax=Scatolibacter rhodanostii TaxID=2014781 RepID=UPI000C06A21A|nr:type IV secretory system conjugative DNA transfer family protein [Scatolibacter rhodanostii]